MKNLVLGADGFIGTALCRYLKNLGESTYELDIKRGAPHDLRTIKTLNLGTIDRVYFLAWDVGGAKYLYDTKTQRQQLENNVALLYNMMPRLMDIPFVFTSSQLASNMDLVYGMTKRLGELWTQQSKHGISVRLWNVYGEMEDDTVRSHVISDFVRQALQGEIKMLTNGAEYRWFTHMDDACKALHHAFDVDGWGPYDVSGPTGMSIAKLARMISDRTGCKCACGKQSLPYWPTSKTCEPLPGWKAEVRFEDGIKRMIEEDMK